MYLGPPYYGYAFNCHIVYLAAPGIRPLCMEKQNVLVFYLCENAKVKFKTVQINMKQVSYMLKILFRLNRAVDSMKNVLYMSFHVLN